MAYNFYNAFVNAEFPNQRVSAKEKASPNWYASSIDFVIAAGQAAKGERDIDVRLSILHGDIPDKYYAKTLNPYNVTKEQWTKFPATMRNYDIMSGIIRRYIGEYIKNPHDFIVAANNPEVMMAKNNALREQLRPIIEQQIAAKIQAAYSEFMQQGGNAEEFNAQEAVDIPAFIEEFNENYVDNISAQGQEILNIIDDITSSTMLYVQAYFDFVALGECYTYTEVNGNKLIKRIVDPGDAYPVPNGNFFVEDYDMFAECERLTYQQIVDRFDKVLDNNTREFLNTYYAKYTNANDRGLLTWDTYHKYFPDVCDKFPKLDRDYFKDNPIRNRDLNSNLIDVWHCVWRSVARRGILRFQNGGFIQERVVDEDYIFNPEAGDIDIEWTYEPQVYHGYRIGGRYDAVYPIKAVPVDFNREGKLPYNGLMELLPRYGRFSIIDIVAPYQILRNIMYYHREMVIAKNKLNILLIAKSLLGAVPDDTIYRMVADGVLYVDDEDDVSMLRTQQIRMLSASNNDYIVQLTTLIQSIEEEAKNQVDMTAQRYGEISNSAGKGVTDEAIQRGSMGSVIVEFVFDSMRERDYARDMDFSKFAWIDGLNTSYKDSEGRIKYLSLDVNSHMYADYLVKAKLSTKEKEKLDQIKQFAFSAAQNGNMDMAIASIAGDNVSSIKKLIMKFQDVAREHEQQMEQMKQQTEQMVQEFELQKIAAKGEQDRATLELEKYLDSQIEQIKANANIMSFDNGLSEANKNQAEERMAQAANNLKMQEIALKGQEVAANVAIKEKEIAAKVYDSDIKLKVAKENKNKYDRPKTAKSKSK